MNVQEFITEAKALLKGAGRFGASIEAPVKEVLEGVLEVIEDMDEKPLSLSKVSGTSSGYLLEFKDRFYSIVYDYNYDVATETIFEKLTK